MTNRNGMRTEAEHRQDAIRVLDALAMMGSEDADTRQYGVDMVRGMGAAVATSTALAMLTWVIHTWAETTGRTDTELRDMLRAHWELS